MTFDRDIEPILDAWLTDGPLQVADRVVDDVAARLARQPQHPAWRLHHWRLPKMSTPIRVIALIGALLIALLGGSILVLGGGGGSALPAPTPSPTLTPSPTPTPLAMPEGLLVSGRYRLHPGFAAAPTLSIDADLPVGWRGIPPWAVVGPAGTDAPGGIGIGFLKVDGLHSDPCHWDIAGDGSEAQPGDVTVGPTVDDLVAALRANTAYTSSTPVPVTVGGYAGQRLELRLPSDLDFATCDPATGDTSGHFYVFGGYDGGLYAQGPGNRWQLSIIDVDGSPMVIAVVDYAGTSDADRAAAQAIVDSLVITL